MMLTYGAWEPDVAGVNAKDAAGAVTMEIAKNVYPTREGWGPIPNLQPAANFQVVPSVFQPNIYQNNVFQVPANAPSAVGLFVAKQKAGGSVIFAGTAKALYKFNSGTSSWDDYSRLAGGVYSVPSGQFWSFVQYGSFVIATNISNEPQVINVDTGATNFANLGGSPPKAKYVAVVGDFVFLANLDSNPRALQNSAINDATGWTIGTGLSDVQEFPDGDDVTGLIGGEFGWVLQQSAIRRAIFQPGFDQAFRYERVEKERGAVGPYSVVGVRDTAFFRAADGFYMFGPGGLRPIGHQRVNNWFVANSDSNRQASILGVSDQTGPRVFWAFYSSPAVKIFDRLIIYDWDQDRWSYAEVSAQVWARAVTAAATLEGLNVYGGIDSGLIPFPFDSTAWQGGMPFVGAISAGGRLAFLRGPPMDATLTTSPLRFAPSGRANVGAVYPSGVFNDAAITVRVGKREKTQDAVTYTGAIVPSTRTGFAWCKASGRFHNIEVNLSQSTGTAWAHAQGVDVDLGRDGRL